MFDTHAANKFGAAPLHKTDAELVRDHQLKADARIQEINQKLLESRTIRAAAETKIALITNQLAALDAREAHLIALNAVNPSDQNLDELRTLRRDLKVDVAVELRVVVKAQKAQDGRRDILLHERSTLLNPITVDAFHRSPIRRFPTEVLIEIFSVTQLDEVHPVGNGPLIVLLRICRQWRTIALDTPSLWSAFSFSLFGRESEDILLSLYLRRSRAALLTIAVNATEYHRAPARGQHRLTLLAAHSERIYSIHFRGLSSTIFDDDDDDGPSLEAFRGRVPRLEILGASPNSDRLVGVFDIAPHLRSLKMTYSSHLRHSHPKIPYTQIQSLHLTNLPEPKDLLHYPNITSLTCIVQEEAFMTPTKDHVVMPGLTALRFQYPRMAATSALDFFDRFTAPTLNTIDITSWPMQQPAGIPALIRRSQCNLKTLVLHKSSVRAGEVLETLSVAELGDARHCAWWPDHHYQPLFRCAYNPPGCSYAGAQVEASDHPG